MKNITTIYPFFLPWISCGEVLFSWTFRASWIIPENDERNLPPPDMAGQGNPIQKYGFNKALLRETNG